VKQGLVHRAIDWPYSSFHPRRAAGHLHGRLGTRRRSGGRIRRAEVGRNSAAYCAGRLGGMRPLRSGRIRSAIAACTGCRLRLPLAVRAAWCQYRANLTRGVRRYLCCRSRPNFLSTANVK
jgi:hypothetical protein